MVRFNLRPEKSGNSPRRRLGTLSGQLGLAILTVGALILGVLTFYQTTSAQTSVPAQQPFANSLQQRLDTIELLKETNRLLREQNDLLRSGQLKVIVAQPTP